MTIDMDALFAKEAFRNIEPERLEAFKKFAALVNGKSTAEVIPLFMQFAKELPKGRNLSRQETDAILSAICESLSEPERSKLQGFIKFMENGRGFTS